MKPKKQKRKEALVRLKQNLSDYISGKWYPSKKDLKKGTTLDKKIYCVTRQISDLESIIERQ